MRPVLLALRALGIGDLATVVPPLRALHRAYPRHELVLAAPAALAPLVGATGAVDRLLATPSHVRTPPTALPWTGPRPDPGGAGRWRTTRHWPGASPPTAIASSSPARPPRPVPRGRWPRGWACRRTRSSPDAPTSARSPRSSRTRACSSAATPAWRT